METELVTARRDLGDINVLYRVGGSGEPVVFLHGLAEDHQTWSRQQHALTSWQTFAYDLRGHGGTSLGQAKGTLRQLGEDMIRFLEVVSGPAHCVGFSLGGTVVLWAAANRPDLVRSACVLGTSSVVGRVAAEFYGARIDLVRAGDRHAIAKALEEDTRAGIARPDVDVESVVAARLAAIGDGRGYCNAAQAMMRLREEPLTPLLSAVACPVTVVGAERDSFCPRKAAEILVSALPHATYREIPGAGHLMNVDAPDAVTDALRAFLATVPM